MGMGVLESACGEWSSEHAARGNDMLTAEQQASTLNGGGSKGRILFQ